MTRRNKRRARAGLRLGCAAAATMLAAAPAMAKTYVLTPLDLGSGFTLSGKIKTDGATGALTAANITGWNLKVTEVTDILYNPGNTANVSSMVTSTGSQLLVPTSPDNFNDGGSLAFRGGNKFQVQVADFTGANTAGGQAFYVAGGAFDFLPLNRPQGTNYVAATSAGGDVFNLTPKKFPGGTMMTGTITTDGSVGPANITDWNILVRDTQTWLFNPGNSSVINDFGISTDGKLLTVTYFDGDGNPGAFSIGGFSAGFDFNGVLLGDFSFDPGGVAGYVSPFAFQTISPLPLNGAGAFVVAHTVPEPATWGLMLTGAALAGGALRGRARRPGLAS